MTPDQFFLGFLIGLTPYIVSQDWRPVICPFTRHKMREVSRIEFADGCNGMAYSCLCGKCRESVSRQNCEDHKEELCHDRLWDAARAPSR